MALARLSGVGSAPVPTIEISSFLRRCTAKSRPATISIVFGILVEKRFNPSGLGLCADHTFL
jgi:hypothetical protein